MSPRLVPGHVLQEAVVFDDLRLVYVPVPKAGSTAILWALAKATGLSTEDFNRSHKLEVTRALAVHDTSIWGASHTFEGMSMGELEPILWSGEWFRLTVVREPVRRLWSAWVSKILVRDPRFVAAFGREDWFPPPPTTSNDVLESFRRFAGVLPTRSGEWHDPHWSAQADVIGVADIAYGHIGRFEQLDRTMAVLADYMGARGRRLPPLRPVNQSLVPFHPGLFDRPSLDACTTWTARDRATFGYEAPSAVADRPDKAWHAAVDAAVPAIRAVIERNERIADLRRMHAEAEEAQSATSRLLGRMRSL
jgi:sulfotransferase famil protein